MFVCSGFSQGLLFILLCFNIFFPNYIKATFIKLIRVESKVTLSCLLSKLQVLFVCFVLEYLISVLGLPSDSSFLPMLALGGHGDG